MKKILLIEPSATLRHAAKKLMVNSGYDVTDLPSFSNGLTKITGLENDAAYDVVCLGWPTKTDDIADELFATLEEPQYHQLGVVVLSHEADNAKLAWVTKRSKTGLVLWENYSEIIDAIESLTEKRPAASVWEPVITNDNAPLRVMFVDDSPTVRATYRRLDILLILCFVSKKIWKKLHLIHTTLALLITTCRTVREILYAGCCAKTHVQPISRRQSSPVPIPTKR